jgi:precorrin-2 C20-methyltransferase/precorrin-3B C17-methyltransferase
MTAGTKPGRLYGVGVGPGDPDLITVKALRAVQGADVVAYLAARHGRSNARAIVAGELTRGQRELALIYPLTTETTDHPDGYDGAIAEFYDAAAAEVAAELDAGRSVAVLCEGDPFFYGSYMYLHDRLAGRYETEVIPGVCSVMAGAARLGQPLVRRDTELAILPGTLPEAELTRRLAQGQAVAIMKLGRNFAKVRRAIERAGAGSRALYIERATMSAERAIPLAEVDPAQVPYFSLVLVPGADVVPVKCLPGAAGRLVVLGLGPGAPEWLSPEAREALADATDLVGYQPYLDRVSPQPGQIRHGSDNKVEAARARHALELALAGRRVCVVSSGDPGIFAMASAVLEQVEAGPQAWRALDIRVLPGISAMQAASARVGAILGHDFCVISLSDRLKPWPTIAERLDAAAKADFALALYNPISSERQWQLGEARSILARHRRPDTPVIIARDVGGAGERIIVTDLAGLDPALVDMRTILLIGNSQTRRFEGAGGKPVVYTPRRYGV